MDDIVREMIAPCVEDAVTAYLECALWVETSDELSIDDIAARSINCARIWVSDALQSVAAERPIDVWPMVAADPTGFGRDLWLTRCRHGAGFWDGRWGDSVGEYLTIMAHSYGGEYLYLGADGKLHFGDEA